MILKNFYIDIYKILLTYFGNKRYLTRHNPPPLKYN